MRAEFTLDDGRQFSIEVEQADGVWRWHVYEHGTKIIFGSFGQRGQRLSYGVRRTKKTALIAATNELHELI